MFESLCALLAAIFEVLLSIAEPLLQFFVGIWTVDSSLSENSRLGESPLAREGRRSWRNCGIGCLVLILLGLIVSALVGWRI